MDRGERRDRTRRVTQRLLRIHQRIMGPPPEGDHRVQSAHRFAKVTPLACHCAKRRHGRPRADVGMCWVGLRDRVYEWRQAAKALRVLARRGCTDWDGDDISLLEDNAYPRFYHDQQGALRLS
jgi:hypothetical protein